MKETYTEKANFKIIIEGEYSIGNLLNEELMSNGELKDLIWEYVANDIMNFYQDADIKIDKLETVKE